MTRRSIATWLLLLLAALGSLSGCGPRCPAFGEVRDDLPASVTSGALSIALRATRIGQANDSPAVVSFRWSGEHGPLALAITDADGKVLAHPKLPPPVNSDPFVNVRAEDEHGAPLPAGLYGITLSPLSGEAVSVTARFEIVHCALYY